MDEFDMLNASVQIEKYVLDRFGDMSAQVGLGILFFKCLLLAENIYNEDPENEQAAMLLHELKNLGMLFSPEDLLAAQNVVLETFSVAKEIVEFYEGE